MDNQSENKITLDLDAIKQSEVEHSRTIGESLEAIGRSVQPFINMQNTVASSFQSLIKVNDVIANSLVSTIKAVNYAVKMREMVDGSIKKFADATKMIESPKLKLPDEPFYYNPIIPDIVPQRSLVDMIDWDEFYERKAEEDELRKLQLIKLRKELGLETSPPSFDVNRSTLEFMKKEIEIPRDTDQFYLCQEIFKDHKSIRKIWSNDEMMNAWGCRNFDNADLLRVYRAGRELNKKVAAKTTVSDLFIYTTKEISVNLSYLK